MEVFYGASVLVVATATLTLNLYSIGVAMVPVGNIHLWLLAVICIFYVCGERLFEVGFPMYSLSLRF